MQLQGLGAVEFILHAVGTLDPLVRVLSRFWVKNFAMELEREVVGEVVPGTVLTFDLSFAPGRVFDVPNI